MMSQKYPWLLPASITTIALIVLGATLSPEERTSLVQIVAGTAIVLGFIRIVMTLP